VGVGVGVEVAEGTGVGVGVLAGGVVGVGVDEGLGVGVAVGLGLGEPEAIGPIYLVAITTLSCHFVMTCALSLLTSRVILTVSILSEGIERKFKLGKSAMSFPSTHHFTSPSFCPGVLALTIIS